MVTISGVNFGATQGISVVKFNGVVAAPTSWSDTEIVVSVPAGATSGPVIVFANEYGSNSVDYIVVQLRVSGVVPSIGQVGSQVTISGSGFGSSKGSSNVRFNGVSADLLPGN